MNKATKHLNGMFHVKHVTLCATVLAMLACLCSCQAPVQDEPKSVNIKAIEAIAESAMPADITPPEEEPNDAIKLPTVKEAEESTGILTEGAGTEYAEDEILVTLKGNAKIADINRQLSLCDFIKENRIGNEMMIVGEIRGGKVEKGSMGEAVVLLHTADGVEVNQAIAGLKETGALKNASPNYLLNAADDSLTVQAESTE